MDAGGVSRVREIALDTGPGLSKLDSWRPAAKEADMNRSLCFVIVAAAALLSATCGGTSPTSPGSTALTPLPHSMKGYELYSWQSAGSWKFALITGTDRSKTIDEITTGQDTASDITVRVSADGVDAVKQQLGRLPAKESISWIGRATRQQWQLPAGPFELPPAPMLVAVTSYCRQLSLDLQVLP